MKEIFVFRIKHNITLSVWSSGYPPRKLKLCSVHFVLSMKFNPLVTNGLSHPDRMDESTFIFRDIGNDFSSLFHFSIKFMSPRFYLPMSHKKDARLKWVKLLIIVKIERIKGMLMLIKIVKAIYLSCSLILKWQQLF